MWSQWGSCLGLYDPGHVDGVGADALGEIETEAGEDLGLLGIGPADASQLQHAAIDEGQDDVATLDAAEGVEHFAGGHFETPRLGEATKGAVNRVGEEADEDVSLAAGLGLVEDGADGEVLLAGSEGGLGVVDLHVPVTHLWHLFLGEEGAKETGT